MLNKFKQITLLSAFSWLLFSPATSFALQDYENYGGGYWDYHGSGRDYAYSQYIDTYYSPGYKLDPLVDEDSPYFNTSPMPSLVTVTPEPPMPLTQAPAYLADLTDKFIVNIPNSKGGYTAVTIRKFLSGYLGPQGEYYPQFPTVAQLQLLYGK